MTPTTATTNGNVHHSKEHLTSSHKVSSKTTHHSVFLLYQFQLSDYMHALVKGFNIVQLI